MERRASPPVPPRTTFKIGRSRELRCFERSQPAGKRIMQLQFLSSFQNSFSLLGLQLIYTHQRVFGTSDKASGLVRDNASVRRSSLGFRAPISLAGAGSLATRCFMVAYFLPGAGFAACSHAG